MNNKKYLFYSISSLFIGGMIYLLFRTNGMIMFNWFDSIGLGGLLNELRGQFSSSNLPDFVIYSLPNSLWVFSGVLAISIIWQTDNKEKSIWIIVFLSISFLSEFAQLLKLIPGTFDIMDIITTLIVLIPTMYLIKPKEILL